jgi:hypothetical protein
MQAFQTRSQASLLEIFLTSFRCVTAILRLQEGNKRGKITTRNRGPTANSARGLTAGAF